MNEPTTDDLETAIETIYKIGREAKLPLSAGTATLKWPIEMSREDFTDFKSWLLLVLRTVARNVKEQEAALAPAPPADAGGEG